MAVTIKKVSGFCVGKKPGPQVNITKASGLKKPLGVLSIDGVGVGNINSMSVEMNDGSKGHKVFTNKDPVVLVPIEGAGGTVAGLTVNLAASTNKLNEAMKKSVGAVNQLHKHLTGLQSSANGPVVMGIDVSTDTGIVVLSYDTLMQAWRTVYDGEINLSPLPKTVSMRGRMERVIALRNRLVEKMEKHRPDVVAVEGYGYANAHSLVTLVEFGTVVRDAMINTILGVAPLEVAPASLKKFILGKGVGKKEQVMMQVFKKWGYEAKTNNLADAYVLAHIAAAIHGPYPMSLTKPQQEVISVVKAKNS